MAEPELRRLAWVVAAHVWGGTTVAAVTVAVLRDQLILLVPAVLAGVFGLVSLGLAAQGVTRGS